MYVWLSAEDVFPIAENIPMFEFAIYDISIELRYGCLNILQTI